MAGWPRDDRARAWMSLTINGTLHGKPFTLRMGGPAIAESGQLSAIRSVA